MLGPPGLCAWGVFFLLPFCYLKYLTWCNDKCNNSYIGRDPVRKVKMTTLKYRKVQQGTKSYGFSWFNSCLKDIEEYAGTEAGEIAVNKQAHDYWERYYEVSVKGEVIGWVMGSMESNWTTYANSVLRRDLGESVHWHWKTVDGEKNHHRLWDDSRIEAIRKMVKVHYSEKVA